MKIALFGYGKMGKTIESIALKRGHKIVARISSKSSEQEKLTMSNADVVIEFTRPESALDNFQYCLAHNLKLVTGTTGWYDHMSLIKSAWEAKPSSFFWASNFSIGVNLFWEVNQKLAKLMASYPEYSVSMDEIHHTQKLDDPSGTAITTANQIIKELPNLSGWKLAHENPSETDLPIHSFREGDVKGTHIVKYESAIDRIELKHEAKTREGFALGAIMAAEYLADKKGFFTMSDLLGSVDL